MAPIIAAIIGGALYRLRGGLFSDISRYVGWEWGSTQRTQTMRLIWAVPTAGLIVLLSQPAAWWLFPALAITVWASMALWGHGAHAIYDAKQFIAFSKGKTELLTEWWVPDVFGGIPDTTWPHWKVTAYNMVGMSFIGLVRNITAILPVSPLNEYGALIYAGTGLLHGPLYWAGYRINSNGWASEILVGAVTWASIVLIFG